ncbi:pitrilysin family protein [Acinetobacter sp. ASP199]|uniref:M16 family metallopeptidase n=1 Tax=unclassified Acinetobacter TaxID=196816 RepID=UPI001F61FC20|nr:pitrilysin family protein [Acinetobacter sp. ASP199]UNT58042.1 insulinase family protein [Acinetobacter sp. ASP199]
MMIKLKSACSNGVLIVALSYASLVWAEIDQNTELLPEDNPGQLQAIPLLQSLKNLENERQFQAPYVHELNNRYKVRTLFVETKDLPMVDIQLTFNAGAARDEEIQKGLFGLSSMAAKLIREGTDTYTAREIAAVFDQSGAQFSAQAYRDMFVIRLRVMSDPKKLEPALAMMMEVLKHASFKNQSISLAVSNTNVGQKQLQESPGRLMDIRFYRTLYGQHPYAQPVTGTIGGTQKVNSEHLKKFRDQFLVAKNMNIAITGKLSPKQALDLSERIAGNLKQGTRAQPLPDTQLKNDIEVVHIPYNSSQAYVMFGHLGPSHFTEDKLALEVANRIFGGSGFNAVLMQELRVKRGFTYAAYSTFSFTQTPGVFSFRYSTRQDQLLDSIQVAHQAFINFVNQPIDTKRLEETKSGMLRAFPNSYSSNATINARLGTMGFYAEPRDYLTSFPERLAKITVKDVENAVRKHLHPDRLTVVVVSQTLDKDGLKTALKANLTNTATTDGLIFTP